MNTLDNELNNEFQISGREMFEFNPDLVGEDDDEATEGVIERERDSDDEVKHRERGRAEWLQKSHFQMCVIVPTSGCLFNCFFVLNEINTWLLWCLIKKKSQLWNFVWCCMELMNYNFQKLDVLGHCLVKKI